MTKNSVLAVVLLIAAMSGFGVWASEAQDHANDPSAFAAGQPGDPQQSATVVDVTMKETGGKLIFVPDQVQVRQGEQIRFVVMNAGQLDHEFFLGNSDEISKHADMMRQSPDMQHSSANAIRLKPDEKGEILWHFTNAGDFEYACLLPGLSSRRPPWRSNCKSQHRFPANCTHHA